jgi:hypothetical protein
LPYLKVFRPSWKGLQGRNTQAYFTSMSEAKKKGFITLTKPVANIIKTFFFVTDEEVKQAQAFATGKLFKCSFLG